MLFAANLSGSLLRKAPFANAGLPPNSPRRVRDTITELANDHCRTPEDFKTSSQNMGHDELLTTFRSYGSIAPGRQLEVMGRFRGGDYMDDEAVIE